MCLAEFAAHYYKDYKTDVSETIDAQPEVLTDDFITQLHARTKKILAKLRATKPKFLPNIKPE